MATYGDFISIFAELECELEPGLAFDFWKGRAETLLSALCIPITDHSLLLALAHVVYLKSNPNGPLKAVENVNSSVTFQSGMFLDNPELTLQWSPYGRMLYEELQLKAWDGDIDYCWPNY
jgi:hypothetical protein